MRACVWPRTTTIGSYPVFPSREDVEYYERMAARGLRDELTDPYLYTIEEVLKDFTSSGVEVVSTGQTRGDLYSLFLDPKFVKGIGWKGSQVYIEGKLERISSIRLSDVKYARQILPEYFEIKEPLTDSYTLARFAKIKTELYLNTEELAREINKQIVLKEFEELQNSKAVNIVQLDSPVIAAESYPPEYLSELYEEIGDARKIPLALHACGDTSRIFERLASLKVDYLLLDFYHYPRLVEEASEREYEQKLGLGVLDSQSPRVEGVEEIETIIESAREKIGDDRIAFVHPHCGQRSLHRNVAFEKNVRMTIARDNLYFGEAEDVSYEKEGNVAREGKKYFLISTNTESRKIFVTFYTMDHKAILRLSSKNAESIIHALSKRAEKLSIGSRELAYLALEVGRAEASLNAGQVYRQKILD